jgi:hypothetical protein
MGDHESTGGVVILPGIASSWMRNPPEYGYSAGNYQLMDADLGQQDQNARKIFRTVTIPGSLTLNALYRECHFFQNVNVKTLL